MSKIVGLYNCHEQSQSSKLHHEKTCLPGFQPCPEQAKKMSGGLKFRIWEVTKTKRDCIIYVANTKVLISCTVTVQLIYAVFPHIQETGFLVMLLISLNNLQYLLLSY